MQRFGRCGSAGATAAAQTGDPESNELGQGQDGISGGATVTHSQTTHAKKHATIVRTSSAPTTASAVAENVQS